MRLTVGMPNMRLKLGPRDAGHVSAWYNFAASEVQIVFKSDEDPDEELAAVWMTADDARDVARLLLQFAHEADKRAVAVRSIEQRGRRNAAP